MCWPAGRRLETAPSALAVARPARQARAAGSGAPPQRLARALILTGTRTISAAGSATGESARGKVNTQPCWVDRTRRPLLPHAKASSESGRTPGSALGAAPATRAAGRSSQRPGRRAAAQARTGQVRGGWQRCMRAAPNIATNNPMGTPLTTRLVSTVAGGATRAASQSVMVSRARVPGRGATWAAPRLLPQIQARMCS